MKSIRLVAFLASSVSAASLVCAQGNVNDPDVKRGRPTPSQEERIQSAISSMRARAVFSAKGEIGETGEWVPPATESVTFVSNGTDFGASLDVGLLGADSALNLTAVTNVILADPRVNSVTAIATTTVTPTAAEMGAFDVIMVWTNSTPLSNVVLGDNIATYVDAGAGAC